MKHFRITCMFQADWVNLIPALFGATQPESSMVGGNVGIFNFSAPIVPNNLGPLVLIETADQPFLFD